MLFNSQARRRHRQAAPQRYRLISPSCSADFQRQETSLFRYRARNSRSARSLPIYGRWTVANTRRFHRTRAGYLSDLICRHLFHAVDRLEAKARQILRQAAVVRHRPSSQDSPATRKRVQLAGLFFRQRLQPRSPLVSQASDMLRAQPPGRACHPPPRCSSCTQKWTIAPCGSAVDIFDTAGH